MINIPNGLLEKEAKRRKNIVNIPLWNVILDLEPRSLSLIRAYDTITGAVQGICQKVG